MKDPVTEGFITDTSSVEWADPPRGYYHTAVKQKVLYENQETGSLMALLKFPVGLADLPHTHPQATQHSFWLEGEMVGVDGEPTPMKGLHACFPPGVEHGNTTFTKESIALFYWDGPQT